MVERCSEKVPVQVTHGDESLLQALTESSSLLPNMVKRDKELVQLLQIDVMTNKFNYGEPSVCL